MRPKFAWVPHGKNEIRTGHRELSSHSYSKRLASRGTPQKNESQDSEICEQLWYVLFMSVTRLEQLKLILEQDPRNTFARYALGMEYSSAGQVDAALREFRTLLEVDANYANAFFMGAQALQNGGRTEEAVLWLRDGIECAQRVGNRHAQSEMQTMLEELQA
jgi:Tfp pilus assembly protein PilF